MAVDTAARLTSGRHHVGRFDTASVPLAVRRRVWSDATARFLIPLDISSPSGTVDGTIGARRAAGITFCCLSATAHVGIRTPALAGACGAGHVKIALPLHGRTSVAQNGHQVTLRPGELCIYDTSRPYSVGSDAPFGLAIALLPRDALELPDERLERIVARRLRGSLLSLVHTGLLRAFSSDLTAHTRDVLLDRLAVLTPADAPAEPRHAALRKAATELLDRRLASSRLNPDYLADVLGVSRRTLYAAFEADGRSVASTIRHARLERARSLLARPDHAGMSVTEVATACGFTSLAHFSRLFHSEFGVTPSGYRQART